MGNKFNIIVAIADNNAIGYKGDLLWHIHEDMIYFKQTTMNHPVLMGRKTWESLQVKPLPKRMNIILTRNKDGLTKDINKLFLEKKRIIEEKNSLINAKNTSLVDNNLPNIEDKNKFPNVEIISNLESLDTLPQYNNEVFIIGGGSIYEEFLSLCDRLYITRVFHAYPQADTFFPQLNMDEWNTESKSEKKTDKESNLQYQFFVLKRKNSL